MTQKALVTKDWKFRCMQCAFEFDWQTHPHKPGDESGGPPPGCPWCGSLYLEPLVWPGDKD